MEKRKRSRQRSVTIEVDSGKLPAWPVFAAMTMAYAESKAWLEHALGSGDFSQDFINMGYQMHFANPITGERRVLVQRGGEDSTKATVLSWDFAISILTLIRLQNYTATYGEPGVVGLYFSFGGDQKRKSDMDRMMLLLAERPEFEMLNLSHDLDEAINVEEEEEETQQADLPAPKA